MGRLKVLSPALRFEIEQIWAETAAGHLRPLSPVRDPAQEPPRAPKRRLCDLEVGEALVLESEDGEGEAQPDWFVCPICGISAAGSSLERVGPSCCLCPGCKRPLPM